MAQGRSPSLAVGETSSPRCAESISLAGMTQPASPQALSQLNADLSGLAERLRSALGDDLISLALYGGAARGTFDPAVSDVNLMLVLRDASLASLDRVATALEPLRLAYKVKLMTLTAADLDGAAELFPTKFLDIERHHVTLFGAEPGGWQVPRERLQRQALRQLVNLRLRLLQVYLESRNQPEQLDAMIRRSVTPLLLNLGVLLELKSGHRCSEIGEVVEHSAVAGVDGSSIDKLLEFKYKHRSSNVALLHGCYNILIELVEKSITFARQII
jgi:hypothetical protein